LESFFSRLIALKVRIRPPIRSFCYPMIQIQQMSTAWHRTVVLLIAIGITCMPVPAVLGDTGTPAPASLLSSLRTAQPPHFCGESVPMDNPEVRERFEKEFLLSLWDQPQVILWLKRSKRYFSIIEPMLKSAGLPDDLKYLAVAESALKPHAGSIKGAMGFWQFIPSTGQEYGLTIDNHKDERRNIFRSTEAAIKFLKTLREEFGSWTLAAAAYNMGEKGLMAEVLEQQTDNYYDLYLPLETQCYLFRILAVKLICTHPDDFGFHLKPGDYYAPVAFDRVRIDCTGETPIRLVAQAAGTRFKVIKDLNPEVRGYHLAQGSHEILVPKGTAAGFQMRFAELVKSLSSGQDSKIYIVQKGDTLSSISAKFDVPLPALIIWNRLDPKCPIHPGDRLTIHPGK
jgi:membrane-bound lytic murein transglycosylase D